jgi:hypothetical protein
MMRSLPGIAARRRFLLPATRLFAGNLKLMTKEGEINGVLKLWGLRSFFSESGRGPPLVERRCVTYNPPGVFLVGPTHPRKLNFL